MFIYSETLVHWSTAISRAASIRSLRTLYPPFRSGPKDGCLQLPQNLVDMFSVNTFSGMLHLQTPVLLSYHRDVCTNFLFVVFCLFSSYIQKRAPDAPFLLSYGHRFLFFFSKPVSFLPPFHSALCFLSLYLSPMHTRPRTRLRKN